MEFGEGESNQETKYRAKRMNKNRKNRASKKKTEDTSDLMEIDWARGSTIGRGKFGTVSIAVNTGKVPQFPTVMAVKSCYIDKEESLRTEKEVLSTIGDCPEIIKLHGYNISFEHGLECYNLFLEYASEGNLRDLLEQCGGKFEPREVKRYTKSILQGLCYIHEKGFAHCDIKPENILVCAAQDVKIADFGLAKPLSEQRGWNLRGSPLFMSPEVITYDEAGSPADIWALGCLVVEMATGMHALNCPPDANITWLMIGVVSGDIFPVIPDSMCSQGQDFLAKCFEKNPNKRWTARMLLDHPFISAIGGEKDGEPSTSPRCPFDFVDFLTDGPISPDPTCSEFDFGEEEDNVGCGSGNWVVVSSRLKELGSDDHCAPDWCDDTDEWVTVR